jgi:hypothetical protein
MDNKPAVGSRIHFRANFTTTPTILVLGGERQAVVFVNETASAVRIGFSGSVATSGLYMAAGASFSDNYSRDEYWGYASSGSGTISGFIVP